MTTRLNIDCFADAEVKRAFEEEQFTDDELRYLYRLLPIKSRKYKNVMYMIQNGVINKIHTRTF